jgi:protocatechuate 3,4-dioxygenase beta subunit
MIRLRALLGAAVAAAVALVAPLGASGGESACPTSNPPNMLTIVGGSPQTAQLGKAFQQNLQVALANSNGCPLTGSLAGISVDFVAPASGASGTFASSASNVAVVGTDTNGVAIAPPFTANGTAGAYSVHAQSDYGTTKLYLTNTAHGVASSLTVAGSAEQTAPVLSTYGTPLEATVLDADGQPVQGATVSFSLGTGTFGAGASFLGGGAQATVLTDSTGVATSPAVIANGVAGTFTATAAVAGIANPVLYSLRNLATRSTLVASATAKTATVGGRYRPLQVRLVGEDGKPVEGATVTFSVVSTAAGAGAGFVGGAAQATALTDATGLASSPALLANTVAGSFTATASAAGVTTPVSFPLRNVAGKPATIVAGVAASSATPVGARFPVRLAVTVTDADNNPVQGARVTFTSPAHGASGRFRGHARTVVVSTGSSGIAVAPVFTANRKPGGYAVVARVAGAKRSAAFALVNEPR